MARREGDLAVLGHEGTLGQAQDGLLDDLHRLEHLRDADAEAVVVVARLADRDAEVEVLVGGVRHRLAQVPRVAGGAQQRAGDAVLQERRLVEGADALQALQGDLVLREEVAVLLDALRHVLAERQDAVGPARRDVVGDAARLDVARVHALAGGVLEEVEDAVALAPAVPEHRHGAEVQGARRQEDEVRRDAVELEVDDAQVLRALGDLDLEQRLDGPAVRLRVEVVGEVVHPLHERDDLPVVLVLAGLLDAGVDVADDRPHVLHDLALEGHEQPQDPVRGGVVRAHVDRQQLALEAVLVDALQLGRDVDGLLELLEVRALLQAHGSSTLHSV